jgi:hypothetical protein
MDVNDPPGPFLDEPWGQDPHETGEGNCPGAGPVDRDRNRPVELLLIDAFAVLSPCWNSTFPRPLKPRSIRFIGGD